MTWKNKTRLNLFAALTVILFFLLFIARGDFLEGIAVIIWALGFLAILFWVWGVLNSLYYLCKQLILKSSATEDTPNLEWDKFKLLFYPLLIILTALLMYSLPYLAGIGYCNDQKRKSELNYEEKYTSTKDCILKFVKTKEKEYWLHLSP